MITMTATDVARKFSKVLDRLESGTEEIAIVRNHHAVAKLVPGSACMTATIVALKNVRKRVSS